ncbi:MAG: hypothetical protein KDA45_16205, partial [Planctomycetales bacterium]|nr:hypothetical protein [Planctomycetales bacterium]
MAATPLPPSSEPPQVQTLDASFALLEQCMQQLARVAPVVSAEQIRKSIPAISGPAQRLIAVELIKYDMAQAVAGGQSRTLEFYWPALESVLPQECLPIDLVL